MTDITFACFAALAFAILSIGIERSNMGVVVVGLLLSLCAMLDRQLGLVLPLGLVLACWFHPRGQSIGRRRIAVMSILLTIVPWIAYEIFLQRVGSTPVTKFQGFENVIRVPLEMGAGPYLLHLLTRFFLNALSYTALFLSPILVLQIGRALSSRMYSRILLVLAVVFAIVETAILSGLAELPVGFQRNVIINFGIGPILFKDTYLLKVPRLTPISTPLFYLLVFWAAVSSLTLFFRAISFSKRIAANVRPQRAAEGDWAAMSFTALLAFLTGLIYLGVIVMTGFHDRYLIPLCLFFGIWLLLEDQIPAEREFGPLWWPRCVAFAFLLILGAFSVAATHDFMETRRSAKAAHDFLLQDRRMDPCHVDGGFEFNGYYCCRRDPVNDRLADVLGYVPSEMIGKRVMDFLDPESENKLGCWSESGERQVKGTPHFECRVLSKTGETKWMEVYESEIELQGNAYVVGNAIDITDRKRAEEALKESEDQYRRLVERSPYGIGIASEGRAAYVNPALVRLLRASSPDEILGKLVLDFMHPEYREAAAQRMAAVLLNQGVAPTLEEKLLRLDGSVCDA
ncbi:MAG: PAS domain S-box protein, partial [Syntrophobacteraceae bacterium]|nr:PAS domain S-box protein [Syntrophobacteraceae bacterium]